MTAGHGMEWKIKRNGTEISVWNMENPRMEWNGRQSSILPCQFHTKFRALYLQKEIFGCRVVLSNIVTEVFNLNIYVYHLLTNRGT